MQSNLLGIALLILVSLNLALTTTLFMRDEAPSTNATVSTPNKPLPASLDEKELARLASSLYTRYNEDDISGLYDDFDELAKIELTYDTFENQFRGMRPLVGEVESAAYAGHTAGAYEGQGTYELRYLVRLREGPFSSGTMKITIMDRGDRFTLLGFRLNGTTN